MVELFELLYYCEEYIMYLTLRRTIMLRLLGFVPFACFILAQALYEALMKQEELLAYIDSQEVARLRVCWCMCLSKHL